MTKMLTLPSSRPMAAREATLNALLKHATTGVTVFGPGRCTIPLDSEGLHAATAILEEGWLSLSATWDPGAAPASAWKALEQNAKLDGLAKITANGKPGGFGLKAELPQGGEVFARELDATLSGLAQVLAQGRTQDQEPEEEPADLAALCQTAGWPFEQKDVGALSVDLEVHAAPYRARLECVEGGGVRIAVPMIPCGEISEISREATAQTLLAVAGAVRMVRPAAGAPDGAETPGAWLEVCLSATTDAAWLDHALSALSVACGLCGRELTALRETELAERYLELRDRPLAALVRPGSQPGQGGA